MAKYINPFTDAGFKRIFGQEQHKGLLIAFLNKLFQGEMVVTDVQYMDKEALPGDSDHKSFIYDIYCTIDTGEHIIVEMQNKQQLHFLQRSALYAARALERQSRPGNNDWNYGELKAVITISFLNFKLKELPHRLLVDGQIIDAASGEHVNKFLRLMYIQLPYMTKDLEECENDFERWIYLLKNIEKMEAIPEYLRSTLEEIKQFEEVMNQASMSAEERLKYERSLKYYRDEMDAIDYYKHETKIAREEAREEGLREGREEGIKEGREEGIKEGREEGREEGIKEGREEGREEGIKEGREEEKKLLASKLKADGFDNDAIAKYTGLTLTQIESL